MWNLTKGLLAQRQGRRSLSWMFCSIICTHNWLICMKLLTYKLHMFICSRQAVRKMCFPNFRLVTVYKLARFLFNRKSHRQGVGSLLPKDTVVHEFSLLHNAFLELHAEEEFVPNSISLGEENNLQKYSSHIFLP